MRSERHASAHAMPGCRPTRRCTFSGTLQWIPGDMAATRLAKGEATGDEVLRWLLRMRPASRPGIRPRRTTSVSRWTRSRSYAADQEDRAPGPHPGRPSRDIRLTSPLPDVVCVRLSHFEGEVPKKPEFAIASAPGPVVVSTSDEAAELTAAV